MQLEKRDRAAATAGAFSIMAVAADVAIAALDELPSATAREDALSAVEAIERRSFPKHESLSEIIRHEVRQRSRTLLLARPRSEAPAPAPPVLGYVLLERSAVAVHVTKLAVVEAHRRRGIGRALLRDAMRRARAPQRGERGRSACARPVGTVTLHVDPERTGAVALYASLGFRETSRRVDYYQVGRDAAFMELDLTAAASSPAADENSEGAEQPMQQGPEQEALQAAAAAAS